MMYRTCLLLAMGLSQASSQQCVSGKHGPACKTDSDCSGVTDCVRCAGSGFCTDVPLPGPSPSPRPSPSPSPSGQCVHGQHGPACKSDSDCSGVTDCVRCAGSGFCTDVPLPGPSPSPGPGPSPSPSISGCTSNNKSFDYFALVQGWPNSWCLTHDCQADYAKTAFWTLHGLWPSRGGALEASYPCTCDSRQFDESQISSVEDDLNKYWPSYSDNKAFWAHEFEKHGTCAAGTSALASELDFFKTTLDLREKHDIQTALSQAGITPDNSKSYSPDQLIQALTSTGGGFKPLLGCTNKNSKQYVHEITFCLDKNLNNIHCDDAVKAGGGELSCCDYSQPLFLVEPGTQPSVVV